MLNHAHAAASSFVAAWGRSVTPAANLFDHKRLEDEKFGLYFQDGVGFPIQVTFYRVEGHPEWMRVMSTNYRCEDEPNDIYSLEAARGFYKGLLAAGFQPF